MYMWMSPQSVDQGNSMEDEEGISSIKTRFAYRFVRSLKQLRMRNNRSPTSYRTSSSSSSSSSSCWSWSNSSPTPTPREIYGRYRMVKLAADASMACAVGPRRAWSRAMILKIRCHDIRAKRIRKRRCGCGFVAKRGLKRRSRSSGSGGGLSRSRSRSRRGEELIIRLRKVVPGGGGEGNIGMNSNNKEMDVSSLLDETAHYIQCLSAQVLVMSNILNHFSFSFPSPPPPPPPPPTHHSP